MTSRFIRYGGIAAKVRAMYGNRLTDDDYEKLAGQKSVSDVAAYLKSLPSWKTVLRSLPANDIHRSELELALREGINQEYERIFRFMPKEDRPLMAYLIRRRELDEIFRFLRGMVSGMKYSAGSIPRFIKKHSDINFECFERCSDYDAFLVCIEDSVYGEALKRLPRKKGVPIDFALARTALTSAFYSEILDLIGKNYNGDIASSLKEAFGTDIDLINIETVLRIKNYFPELTEKYTDFIIPLFRNLSPDFFRRLADTRSKDEMKELLASSRYAKLFTSKSYTNLEDYRRQFLYDHYKRLLSAPAPSVFTPIAYLGLKEIEVRNIINIIECVRYGETPSSANITVVGSRR